MNGRAYSIDLRVRVLTDLDEGMSKASIARQHRVSTRWVYRLQKQREETGDIAPRRGKTGPKRKLAEHGERLTELVREQPDATRGELQPRPQPDRAGVRQAQGPLTQGGRTHHRPARASHRRSG